MKRGRTAVPRDGSEPLESARKQLRDLTTSVRGGELLPPVFFVDRRARSEHPGVRFFLKKDEATDCARERGNLPVWSIDKTSDGGAKYFVVASYDAFWEAYENCERPSHGSPRFAPDQAWRDYENTHPNERLSRADADLMRETLLRQCFQILPFAYEVVLEGVPLHLYLDIEASLETNPQLDGEALVQRLLGELKAFLCNMRLGVPAAALLNPELVVFDSSTHRKVSKHIIFKINGVLWGNNYVCGAMMHSFHLHLIRRFGPEASNPFYVNPEAAAKSSLKVCFLDFAVYTKNRDFRVLGSCKRKGCQSQQTQLRWLWEHSRPGELTKELFLKSLIQNCDDSTVQVHIHNVWDYRSLDGIPFSSSLRTPQPLGGLQPSSSSGMRITTPHSRVGTAVSGEDGLVFSKVLEKRLERLGERVGGWIARCRNAPFYNYFCNGKSSVKKVTLRKLRDGNYAWNIETNSNYCSIRKEKTGTGEHKRGGRTANFLVWITGLCKDGLYDIKKEGSVKQMCIANTCTGGHGPSKPAWTGWLGFGIGRKMRDEIRELITESVQTEAQRLSLNLVGQPDQGCMFIEDE